MTDLFQSREAPSSDVSQEQNIPRHDPLAGLGPDWEVLKVVAGDRFAGVAYLRNAALGLWRFRTQADGSAPWKDEVQWADSNVRSLGHDPDMVADRARALE
jgi:hypothetical protein